MYATATKMAMKEGFELTGEQLDEITKPPFDPPYKKVDPNADRKDKFGNVIKKKNVAKNLAKQGMNSVKEDELDELSRKTLGSYVSKASDARGHKGLPTKKVDNRYTGVSKASKKMNEEDDVDEALKYEGKFKVGDVVRAYDFKPMKDRKNVYVQGKIVKAGTMVQGAKVYEVKIENDSGKTSGRRIGDIAYVPMQVSMFEYDGRIVKVSDIKEGVDLDEANVAKMSDDVLKSRLSQMEKSLKTRGDSPAIQFEIKRLKKEMKKRGIQEEVELDKLPDMSDALRQVRMNEEVDLDEALAPNVVRGDDYVGVPDRVVALAKQKVKKMNTSTASDHSKAMQKALSDMGWEMTVSGKYVKEEAGLDEAPRRPKAPKMKTTDIMRDRGKKAGPKTYQVDIDGSRATVTAASEKMAIQKAMTQLKINKKIKPLPKATVKVMEEVGLDEANPAKMSDDVLKSKLSQMEKSLKTRGDSPAIQFEIKRLTKEMKKRGIQEEVELDEAFKINATNQKLNDGSTVNISKDDASALNGLYNSLNPANAKTMIKKMMQDKKSYGEILAFAKQAM